MSCVCAYVCAAASGGRGEKSRATCIQCIVLHSWKCFVHFVFHCLMRDLFAFVCRRESWKLNARLLFDIFHQLHRICITHVHRDQEWTLALGVGMGQKYSIQQNRLTEHVNGFHNPRFEIVVSTCSDPISRWKCLDTSPYRRIAYMQRISQIVSGPNDPIPVADGSRSGYTPVEKSSE